MSMTEILIQKGILKNSFFTQALSNLGARFAVIMDETVASLYRPLLQNTHLDLTFFTFPPGEKSKTRRTKEYLEDQLFSCGFDRGCVLISMGGGVTLDLGGFIAATFCRGVSSVFIPTTLLAMVDAAIGGKTAVNTPYGKNLIGAFYLPKLIVMDPDCLDTLPEHEHRSGMAEVIKYALTLDPTILEITEKEKLIQRCVELKSQIVQEDYLENGKRRMLNFGHTIGHAIEALEGYAVSHGDAIAVGMLIECLMSCELGYLNKRSFSHIFNILTSHGFPLEISPKITQQNLLSQIAFDKKGSRFIVLKDIGEVVSTNCHEVTSEILERALDTYAELTCKT
jgi:3-dehydroquinate synthase